MGDREVTNALFRNIVCCAAMVVLLSGISRAEEPEAADGLIELNRSTRQQP
jgi:hypothetical protein